jgi:coenzyme F420-reducing hydrogenase delta subunit
MQYPANVRIIHTLHRQVATEHILEAFEKGIDGILVAGCLKAAVISGGQPAGTETH